MQSKTRVRVPEREWNIFSANNSVLSCERGDKGKGFPGDKTNGSCR
jgi:hypothetical protein